jgi:hypothetical protein
VSGLNKLAGTIFGTIACSDEGTVLMATGGLVKGAPTFECEPTLSSTFHDFLYQV